MTTNTNPTPDVEALIAGTTPGPWEWDKRIRTWGLYRKGHTPNCHGHDSGICRINPDPCGETDPTGYYPGSPEQHANAELIAAAPELAAMVRTLFAENAALRRDLAHEQCVDAHFGVEHYEGDDWWVTSKTTTGYGPFDTEAEAEAKAAELNAPIFATHAAAIEQARAEERDRILAELRHAIDNEPIGGQKRWAFKIAADRIEANWREGR